MQQAVEGRKKGATPYVVLGRLAIKMTFPHAYMWAQGNRQLEIDVFT